MGYYLFFAEREKKELTAFEETVYTIISAIFSGLFGIGGPLLSVIYLKKTNSKEEYIANFQLMFAINSTISLLTRICKGFYTLDLIPYTIAGILCVNIGKILGLRIIDRINTKKLEKIVYSAIGISSIVTILQNTGVL